MEKKYTQWEIFNMLDCVYLAGKTIYCCDCETDGRTECKYTPVMLPETPGTMPSAFKELAKPGTMTGQKFRTLTTGASRDLGTNPKDLLGAKKIDLAIVPSIGVWEEACAFFDGGIEYDPFNWRDNKVLARVYIGAMRRHLDLWESGQEKTGDTDVHHLGALRACANILLDAQLTGNLIDNRPKNPAMAGRSEQINVWAKKRAEKGRFRNV